MRLIRIYEIISNKDTDLSGEIYIEMINIDDVLFSYLHAG
jgi:hypothetical protein